MQVALLTGYRLLPYDANTARLAALVESFLLSDYTVHIFLESSFSANALGRLIESADSKRIKYHIMRINILDFVNVECISFLWTKILTPIKLFGLLIAFFLLRNVDNLKLLLYSSPSFYTLTSICICKFFRIPIVLEVNELVDKESFVERHGFLKWIFYLLFHYYPSAHADGLFVISTYIQQCLPSCSVPTLIIPAILGKKYELYCSNPELNICNTSERLPTLVYTGNAKPEDGLHILLEASNILWSSGHEHTLLLIGNKLSIYSCISSLSYNHTTSFNVIGNLSPESYISMLRQADLAVLPRPSCRINSANFPTRIPQYLAAGVPTIVGSCGDIKKYLKHGETAVFFDNTSPAHLASLILDILANPNLRRQLARNGLLEVQRSFSIASCSAIIKQFLQKL